MTKDKEKVVKYVHPDDRKDKEISPITGSKDDDFCLVLLRQAINTMWTKHSDKEQVDKQINAVVAGLIGIRPKDELEGMLAAQMVATHNAAMECFRRGMIHEQTIEGREMNLSQANKLMRSYAALMEALQRYRGKGQQKMTVEHVHVHAGGQAIVGNVNHSKGGGVISESGEQAHAQQVTYAPEQAMPSPNKEGQPVPIPSHD